MALSTSLISYWKMDEASGNALDAHGSNELTETSGTIASTTGIISNGRDFELGDTEYFSRADNTDLSTGDIDFSIQAWVKFETLPPTTSHQVIVSKFGSSTTREYLIFVNSSLGSNGQIGFIVSSDGAATASNYNATNLTTGVWYHVVGVHNSVTNEIITYVNGTSTSATSHSGGVFDSNSDFELGRITDLVLGDNAYLDGLIDEVGFWKKALTPAEILQLYNSGFALSYSRIIATPPSTALYANLVSYYKLDEVSGQAVDAHGFNDLIETSGTIASAAGKIVNARDFESGETEYFSHVDNTDLSTGDIDFSLQAWVNAESFSGGNNWILSKEGVAHGEYELQIDSIGTLAFKVYGTSGYGSSATATWGSLLSTGTWYLVHAWHDSANNQIGISVNAGTPVTTSHSAGVYDSTEPFEIGALSAYGRYFDGLVDEVGFWKRVLTSSERTQLYNNVTGISYDDFDTVLATSQGNFLLMFN